MVEMESTTLYINNGQSPANTQREEERPSREGSWKRLRIAETHPQSGASEGEQQCEDKHQCLVSFENASEVTKTSTIFVSTTEELESFLIEKYEIDSSIIGLVFYSSRSGVLNRKQIIGKIPSEVDHLYVKLYLKKHPPFSRVF